jgi:S-adenosylmethionine synthetase
VWFAHCVDDEFAPVHVARDLAAQLPDSQLLERHGAGHVDVIADDVDAAVEWLVSRRP